MALCAAAEPERYTFDIPYNSVHISPEKFLRYSILISGWWSGSRQMNLPFLFAKPLFSDLQFDSNFWIFDESQYVRYIQYKDVLKTIRPYTCDKGGQRWSRTTDTGTFKTKIRNSH